MAQNYRSTGVILDAANSVIANNTERKGKNLWTAGSKGEVIDVHTAEDDRDEAKYVANKIEDDVRNGGSFSDNAVLYRKNSQSRALENHFARAGIPYRIIGGFRFYDRKEVKDILAYLQLINNHNDTIRLKRIVNEPKRGIGEKTVADASEISAAIGESVFEVMCDAPSHPKISRSAAAIGRFCDLINDLTKLSETSSVTELCEAVIKESGYETALIAEGEEGKERLDNIRELVNSIRQYEIENDAPSLSGFLEEVSLISDIDRYDAEADAVVMMTVHSAKGLEFNNVYLVGMEEGIFPGTQSIYEGKEELEEERRLAYVAITRAKKRLYITNAYTRFEYGQTTRNLPSRFLEEIPSDLCKVSSGVMGAGMFGASIKFSDGEDRRTYSAAGNRGGYRSNRSGYGDRSGYGSRGGYGGGRDGRENGYGHGSGGSYGVNGGREGFTAVGNRTAGRSSSYQTAGRTNAGGYTPKPAAPKISFSAGERVKHGIFGEGVVLSAEPMGNDTLLRILFDNVGEKKIMANFAKLEKI